jgi:hypothetical protein
MVVAMLIFPEAGVKKGDVKRARYLRCAAARQRIPARMKLCTN